MSDTKMLQAILDGQRAIKEELSGKIDKLDKKVDFLEKKVDDGFEKVNKRMDTIGLSLARLEDDAPTNVEFNKLEKRVSKLEDQVVN